MDVLTGARLKLLKLLYLAVELSNDEDSTFLSDGILYGHSQRQTIISQRLMLLSETLHVERTFANEIAEGNYIIFNSKLSIVTTLEAIPKPDSAEVCLIHGCSRPLGYAFKSGSA